VNRSMDAVLPIPCAGLCASGTPIVLEVLPGPTYRVNQRPVAANELFAYLLEVYRDRPEKVIQVDGHPTVRYNDVVHAMDIARSAGVKILGIARLPSS
jgi:biopolymer transport protein TolR